MARADRDEDSGREIHLIENPDGQWTARDCRLEVTTQGESRAAALATLDGVVEAVAGNGGHEPTDAELRELSVGPDIARSQGEEFLDILE